MLMWHGLWCETEGCQHPVLEKDKRIYEFEETREWVRRIAPYANFFSSVLRTAAQVALPAANVFFGGVKFDDVGIGHNLGLMKARPANYFKENWAFPIRRGCIKES